MTFSGWDIALLILMGLKLIIAVVNDGKLKPNDEWRYSGIQVAVSIGITFLILYKGGMFS